MNLEYHRPKTLAEAVSLIARPTPITIPIGGGATVKRFGQTAAAIVDLQDLGLDEIKLEGNILSIGSAVKLEEIAKSHLVPPGLRQAALRTETKNIRQMGSIAGCLVTAGGRSILCAAMLAMDARLIWAPGDENQAYGEYLPLHLRPVQKAIITEVRIPVNIKFGFDIVTRSPRDLPIVGGFAAQWENGRTRVVLCGYGDKPVLVMDSPSAEGAETAALDAYSQAGDAFATARYRQAMAGVLIRRIIDRLN